MSKSFRCMRFSLFQESTVMMENILEQFDLNSFYLSKPRETKGEIYYCGDSNSDFCQDYIRSTIPENSTGGIRFFEYLKNKPDSGETGLYSLQDVQKSAYSVSLEDFTETSGIDTSIFQSKAGYCRCFSVIQFFQFEKLLTLPMIISLETITFENVDCPIRLFEVEDLLSSEDLTVTDRWKDDKHLIYAKDIILNYFNADMCQTNISIPDIGRSRF